MGAAPRSLSGSEVACHENLLYHWQTENYATLDLYISASIALLYVELCFGE
jgi:hypothetical protein